MLYKLTVFLLNIATILCILLHFALTFSLMYGIISMLGKFRLLFHFRQDSQELSVCFVNIHMENREIREEISILRIEVFSLPWYNSIVLKTGPYN